jgi:hypothetical protein
MQVFQRNQSRETNITDVDKGATDCGEHCQAARTAGALIRLWLAVRARPLGNIVEAADDDRNIPR